MVLRCIVGEAAEVRREVGRPHCLDLLGRESFGFTFSFRFGGWGLGSGVGG